MGGVATTFVDAIPGFASRLFLLMCLKRIGVMYPMLSVSVVLIVCSCFSRGVVTTLDLAGVYVIGLLMYGVGGWASSEAVYLSCVDFTSGGGNPLLRLLCLCGVVICEVNLGSREWWWWLVGSVVTSQAPLVDFQCTLHGVWGEF